MTDDANLSADEQRQYFEAMDSLFSSLGWQVLMSDVKGMMSAIHAGILKISPDKLLYEQGRYEGLSQLANFQQGVENAKQASQAPVYNELEQYD